MVNELVNAFTGEELNGYLGMVQALPNTNLFSDSSQIFLVGNPSTRVNSDSHVVAVIAAGTAGFAFLSVVVAWFTFYRRRRKHRRQEASDKFLDDIAESATEFLSDKKSSINGLDHEEEDLDGGSSSRSTGWRERLGVKNPFGEEEDNDEAEADVEDEDDRSRGLASIHRLSELLSFRENDYFEASSDEDDDMEGSDTDDALLGEELGFSV
jgi:cbb3-type cytochrome oxidase subunit 3